MENIKSILKNIEIGYELESKDKKEFSTAFELSMYLESINPTDVWSSESIAICAGRLMVYLSSFSKFWTKENRENVERYENLLHHNYCVLINNAKFCAERGK